MVIGSLALAGFPLTSGFFSKDAILLSAWSTGGVGKLLAILGLMTAFLTAFYSFRLIFVVFWGRWKIDPRHAPPVHEPPPTMTIPLVILAALSILTGYVGIPSFIGPVFGAESEHHYDAAGLFIMLTATAMGLGGIALAYVFYVKSPWLPDRVARSWEQAYRLSLNKWFVDELYDRMLVQPTFRLADGLWRRIDVGVIDAAVDGVARTFAWWGWLMRLAQSGQTQHYALGMALGAVLMLTAYLLF